MGSGDVTAGSQQTSRPHFPHPPGTVMAAPTPHLRRGTGAPCATQADAREAAAADRRLRDAMAGYQRGDRDAFERLYGQLSPVVKRYLSSLAREPSRVDDLVQETFLQIHRARHTFDPAYAVTPWVLAIARHVFLMDRRYRNRRHEFAWQPLDEAAIRTVEAHEGAIIARSCLKQALGELSPTTREALLLHHVCGLSFREIARRLKVGNPALRCRASRAVARMREALASQALSDPRCRET